ncbi:MAG: ParB/RepB/Spo0J family partition protein [Tissierellia bacterium]|nr:ParB/RepB/Spo0J family partition protein [Tissierellia bacterium]
MTRKKGGLNRGLGAFISDKNKVEEILKPSNELEIQELKLDDVEPREDQPRQAFDEESLKELANSISEYGVIQPIIVRKVGKKYEIVAGERRYRASKLANKDTIPAIIRELDDFEGENLSIIENIQREDLNPYDEAVAYKSIIDKYELTQEDLSKAIGKSRPYISNTIRLLRLDERVLEFLKSGQISYSIGRELLSITDNDEQYKRALEIMENKISVKAVAKAKKRKKRIKSPNIHLMEVEESFMDRLGTKVRINESQKVISINYYDNEDLQRIIEIIVGE